MVEVIRGYVPIIGLNCAGYWTALSSIENECIGILDYMSVSYELGWHNLVYNLESDKRGNTENLKLWISKSIDSSIKSSARLHLGGQVHLISLTPNRNSLPAPLILLLDMSSLIRNTSLLKCESWFLSISGNPRSSQSRDY